MSSSEFSSRFAEVLDSCSSSTPQNYKKLCGLIKITRMFDYIDRSTEQGSLVRDIIRESEGERIPQLRLFVENVREPVKEEVKKVEVKQEPLGHVQHCLEELEPVDEIISSPYSRLKARPPPDTPRAIGAVKVGKIAVSFKPHFTQMDLDTRFSEVQPTPKASPVASPTSTSSLNIPSSPLTLSTSIKPVTPFSQPINRSGGGIRKIKQEAFILNPLKGKTDPPQKRKLDVVNKVKDN